MAMQDRGVLPTKKKKSPSTKSSATLALSEEATGDILARLARVEGQIRAVQRMITEKRDCYAIVHQLGASKAALERATAQLMVTSLVKCVRTAHSRDDDAEIQKLMDAFVKLL